MDKFELRVISVPKWQYTRALLAKLRPFTDVNNVLASYYCQENKKRI